jgi:UDP-glucose 4-epimerase
MKKILVTGGGGYIGSHTIVDLIENGFEVISIDNFSRSFETSFDGIEKITGKRVKNYNIDLCDLDAVVSVLQSNQDIVGVIHFAAYKSVPESVEKPLLYYKNNMDSLFNILSCCKQFNIETFVFSSSCSVYGNPDALPVTEETPLKKAECAYAATKQMGEIVVEDVANSAEMRSIALRYFNPVGAHDSALIGEQGVDKPNNLLPIVTQTAAGIIEKMSVWGDDYDTRDGSCIRDYIHVMDIANAHTKALQYLLSGQEVPNFQILNLGSGNGVSVLEVLKSFEKISGVSVNYTVGPRRDGDVIAVYADNSKAKSLLNWDIKHDTDSMLKTAWAWQKSLLNK